MVECIRMDLFRLLPPLSRPVHLGKDNRTQFMAHSQAVYLGQVRKIDERRSPKTRDDIKVDIQPVLQRYRKLKEIVGQIDLSRAFKWAVQEKKDLESLDTNNNSNKETTNAFVQSTWRRIVTGENTSASTNTPTARLGST